MHKLITHTTLHFMQLKTSWKTLNSQFSKNLDRNFRYCLAGIWQLNASRENELSKNWKHKNPHRNFRYCLVTISRVKLNCENFCALVAFFVSSFAGSLPAKSVFSFSSSDINSFQRFFMNKQTPYEHNRWNRCQNWILLML